MFQDLSVRKRALQPKEEYRVLLDMVQKYAIHYQDVAISCKKVNCFYIAWI